MVINNIEKDDDGGGDGRPRAALRGIALNKSYAATPILSCLKHTKQPVLDNLDICVPKGKIYSLLGPSGSGKTTLLKCLLGLIKIDSGHVQLHPDLQSSDDSRKLDLQKLGFMPQEACLYNELQLAETFFYFGKLYSMSNKAIKERQDFLISLLDLPPKRTFVNTYSGGQLRRTSLAIALLNSPRLLVLDEPTVGCDPILRKRIWDFLVDESVNKATTIIITTHYLDEARRADWVGFIRSGVIIEESQPEILINKYNKLYLEDVFYTLCSSAVKSHRREIENGTRSTTVMATGDDKTDVEVQIELLEGESRKTVDRFDCESVSTSPSPSPSPPPDNNDEKRIGKRVMNKLSFSWSRMVGHIYKDGLKCMRNKKLLLINLVVPLVQITLFCLCIGKTPNDLQIGYINHEPSNLAHPLGQMLIDAFDNKTVIKKRYDTFKEGYKELKEGQIWLLVEIDQNFTIEIMKYIIDKKQIPYKFDSKVHVYTDNTNHQISLTLREVLFRSFQKLVEKYHSNIDLIFFLTNDDQYQYDEKFAYPLVFETPVYGSLEPIFTHFMAPGIALSVIFFMSVASTASNFVNERRQGLIERSYLTGVKTIEILISQLFVYSLLMFVQVFIIMVLLFGFIKIPLNGSVSLLIVLMTSQGFCGLCYGLFLASFLYDEETVIQATLASFYPILLMSGIIWPIEAQPYWLKGFVSRYLPLTYASDAFRAILEKNWSLSNFYVLRGFVATYIWTAFFCLFFLVMFTKKFRI